MTSTPMHKRDLARIIGWTIAANFLGLALIIVTLTVSIPSEISKAALSRMTGWIAASNSEPQKSNLAVSYIRKSDEISAAIQKTSLNLTRVGKLDDGAGEFEAAGEEQAVYDEAAFTTDKYEEVRAMAIQPILKPPSLSGKLEIGSFKPITVSGSSDSCVDLGHSMLMEAKSSKKLLEVVIDTEAITIAKICTRNGAVFLTCRANQITISPRKSRPDNGC